MIEELKNIRSDKRALRKFGVTIGAILMAFAGFLFWKEKEPVQLLLTIGILLFMTGLIIPLILKPVYWIWMILATILAWVMTRVILSLLFYLVITSIGLVSRIFGKRFLEKKWDKSRDTYWNYRKSGESKENLYERPF